jgi:hypothetical protein
LKLCARCFRKRVRANESFLGERRKLVASAAGGACAHSVVVARMADGSDWAGAAFRAAMAGLPDDVGPLVLGHFDADALSAVAILARAFC